MSIWQLPMGTYYSQLARGFLFPSSQPVPASKSCKPDQNCLQMLCRVAKLCWCSGMALCFQLHNEVAVSQNCPNNEKSSALRATIYLRQNTNHLSITLRYASFLICPIHLLHFGDEMIDFSLMNRCSEPWVALKCPAVPVCGPAMVDSIMQLTSITLLLPAECLLKEYMGCYTWYSTARVMFTLCSLVSIRVQLFLISESLLVCCQPFFTTDPVRGLHA